MTRNHQERLQKIKAKYPNAYKPWSAEDDQFLTISFSGGMGVDALAKILQRQPSAIRSRLHKLVVAIPNNDKVDNYDTPPLNKSDNPVNDTESTISNLISISFTPLMDVNQYAYSLLISKIQNGFFEKPQPKNAINTLADNIIEAILKTGD